MARQRELREVKLPSLAKMRKMSEQVRKEKERQEKKETRDHHRAFIQSGVKNGFTVREVLWIMRNFSRLDHKHWDGRVS